MNSGHGLAFNLVGEYPHRMPGIIRLGTVAVGFVMGQVTGAKIADVGEPLTQFISLGAESCSRFKAVVMGVLRFNTVIFMGIIQIT